MLHDLWFWVSVFLFVAGYGSIMLHASDHFAKLTRQHYAVMLFWAPIIVCCFIYVSLREWIAAARKPKRLTIWVNAREFKDLRPGRMKYETICAFAGESLEASVIWHTTKGARKHGMLCRGESVMLEDDMEFTAVVTGAA